MEGLRKPFQGIINIVRFNWHFYLLAAIMIISLFIMRLIYADPDPAYFTIALILIAVAVIFSLVASWYVYDLSDLYSFPWLDRAKIPPPEKAINIHAGFDETSYLLQKKYPEADFMVFDFYDERKHTEVSVKRARKTYRPFPGTRKANTSQIPLDGNCLDAVFVIFAAHEIRNQRERINFFIELTRITRQSGKIIVTEHLRDLPNFLAYQIGFFHFFSKKSWHRTFKTANLRICMEIKTTPFITTFILEKNGAAC